MKGKMLQMNAIVLRLAAFLLLAAGIMLGVRTRAYAATAVNQPLDAENPVYFYGDTIEYQGKTITLDDRNIYLDKTLSDEVCAKYDHVYNDFLEAYNDGAVISGTETEPMNVWIAPNVYWMDDPDDPQIRDGVNGDSTPYALWMNVSYLSLNGLTDDPENVVFAVNRGHGAGATGNYTMFYINGTGTHTENMTFGNYCCVDLVYPLDPGQNREKRQTAITQSQLILTNGTKITADNCNFDSRLNSCPFVGGTRILFTDCHFECTDDSLPTSAVYVNCDFEFYSSKPFYSTSGTGSVMLGCDFRLMHNSSQYLTKAGGVVTIIDGTFYSAKKDQYIGWTPDPIASLRCYAGNVSVQYDYTDSEGNAQSEFVEHYVMDADAPYDNVDITGTSAMNAYRLTYNGQTVYNVYNLLKGSDDWDPLGQKELIEAAEAADQEEYTDVAVMLTCSPALTSMTNGGTKKISTAVRGFSSASQQSKTITWSVEDAIKDYITIQDNGDGTCTLACKNETLNVVKGMVYAKDASGLCAGVYVTASPQTMDAPSFVQLPVMAMDEAGKITLDYSLSYEGLEDYSDITWYRSSDADGINKIAVAVTENDTPLKTYTLSFGDIGYYLIAVVKPKQQCTYTGNAVSVVTTRKIVREDVIASPFFMETDFSDFAYAIQNMILPGFWMSDTYKDWSTGDRYAGTIPWTYDEGVVSYGDEGLYGLLPVNRGARLVYTPVEGSYGDMGMTLVINPEKNAGQGFGSAVDEQHMDVYIKYDAATQTGYGLHLQRTSDCGVGASLVQFVNGEMTTISEVVNTSAFNAECTIQLSVTGNKLSATMTTTHAQSEKQILAGLVHSVELSADIEGNTYGGLGFIFTGSIPAGNRVMFNRLSVTWDENTSSVNVPTGTILAAEDISGADAVLPAVEKYTGSEICPEVTVTYKGQTLAAGRDYKVEYSTNIEIGTAAVTITGRGNYTGTITKTFAITEDGKVSSPAPTVPQDNKPAATGTDTSAGTNTTAAKKQSAPKKGTTFVVKGIKYKITNASTNGKGTVTVIGASKKTITSLKIGATVTYNGITYKINAIKAGAFKGYKKLKTVTIGKNIKTIGKQAFYNCGKLKTITIKSALLTKKNVGSKAFAKISSTAKIKVPAKKLKLYKAMLKKRGVTGKNQKIK